MEVPHVRYGKRIPFAPAAGAENSSHQQKRMVAGLQGWTLSQADKAGAANDCMEGFGYRRFHATTSPIPCSRGNPRGIKQL